MFQSHFHQHHVMCFQTLWGRETTQPIHVLQHNMSYWQRKLVVLLTETILDHFAKPKRQQQLEQIVSIRLALGMAESSFSN